MTPDTTINVTLDRVRPVRWTNRAAARNASLPRPVQFSALARRKHSLYAICAILWAALVEKEHPFEAPEDLAEHLVTVEQQLAALKVIEAMVAQAFPEKKSQPSSDTSAPGLPPSSTPVSVPGGSNGGI